MNIEISASDAIPRFAWCAFLGAKGRQSSIILGSGVEQRDTMFFQGAWSEDYTHSRPWEAAVVCGSGGAVQHDSVLFWTGSDGIYPLFSIRTEAGIVVSNSPVFAMVQAGEEPDSDYPFYFHDFVKTVRRGLVVDTGLRLKSGKQLNLHVGHVMSIDANLETSFSRYPSVPHFADFSSYRRYLGDTMRSVLSNAKHTDRRNPLKSISTSSAGYDALAASVVASEAGCRDMISISNSRSPNPFEDCGLQYAETLNMTCRVYDRWDYVEQNLDVTESFLFPTPGYPSFRGAEADLHNSLLIVGSHTGQLAVPERIAVFGDHWFPQATYSSSFGHLEFALRVGFVVFPAILMGSGRTDDLLRITNSEEMAPWRLNNDYDKPFFRRIVEESGIERNSFGLKKMDAPMSQLYVAEHRNTKTNQQYDDFFTKLLARQSTVRATWYRVMYFLTFVSYQWVSRKPSYHPRPGKLLFRFTYYRNRPKYVPWKYTFSWQWVFETLRSRYHITGE